MIVTLLLIMMTLPVLGVVPAFAMTEVIQFSSQENPDVGEVRPASQQTEIKALGCDIDQCPGAAVAKPQMLGAYNNRQRDLLTVRRPEAWSESVSRATSVHSSGGAFLPLPAPGGPRRSWACGRVTQSVLCHVASPSVCVPSSSYKATGHWVQGLANPVCPCLPLLRPYFLGGHFLRFRVDMNLGGQYSPQYRG